MSFQNAAGQMMDPAALANQFNANYRGLDFNSQLARKHGEQHVGDYETGRLRNSPYDTTFRELKQSGGFAATLNKSRIGRGLNTAAPFLQLGAIFGNPMVGAAASAAMMPSMIANMAPAFARDILQHKEWRYQRAQLGNQYTASNANNDAAQAILSLGTKVQSSLFAIKSLQTLAGLIGGPNVQAAVGKSALGQIVNGGLQFGPMSLMMGATKMAAHGALSGAGHALGGAGALANMLGFSGAGASLGAAGAAVGGVGAQATLAAALANPLLAIPLMMGASKGFGKLMGTLSSARYDPNASLSLKDTKLKGVDLGEITARLSSYNAITSMIDQQVSSARGGDVSNSTIARILALIERSTSFVPLIYKHLYDMEEGKRIGIAGDAENKAYAMFRSGKQASNANSAYVKFLDKTVFKAEEVFNAAKSRYDPFTAMSMLLAGKNPYTAHKDLEINTAVFDANKRNKEIIGTASYSISNSLMSTAYDVMTKGDSLEGKQLLLMAASHDLLRIQALEMITIRKQGFGIQKQMGLSLPVDDRLGFLGQLKFQTGRVLGLVPGLLQAGLLLKDLYNAPEKVLDAFMGAKDWMRSLGSRIKNYRYRSVFKNRDAAEDGYSLLQAMGINKKSNQEIYYDYMANVYPEEQEDMKQYAFMQLQWLKIIGANTALMAAHMTGRAATEINIQQFDRKQYNVYAGKKMNQQESQQFAIDLKKKALDALDSGKLIKTLQHFGLKQGAQQKAFKELGLDKTIENLVGGIYADKAEQSKDKKEFKFDSYHGQLQSAGISGLAAGGSLLTMLAGTGLTAAVGLPVLGLLPALGIIGTLVGGAAAFRYSKRSRNSDGSEVNKNPLKNLVGKILGKFIDRGDPSIDMAGSSIDTAANNVGYNGTQALPDIFDVQAHAMTVKFEKSHLIEMADTFAEAFVVSFYKLQHEISVLPETISAKPLTVKLHSSQFDYLDEKVLYGALSALLHFQAGEIPPNMLTDTPIPGQRGGNRGKQEEPILIGKVAGFASGGYTGDGPAHKPAGIVHKGEFVLPQWITTALGLDNPTASQKPRSVNDEINQDKTVAKFEQLATNIDLSADNSSVANKLLKKSLEIQQDHFDYVKKLDDENDKGKPRTFVDMIIGGIGGLLGTLFGGGLFGAAGGLLKKRGGLFKKGFGKLGGIAKGGALGLVGAGISAFSEEGSFGAALGDTASYAGMGMLLGSIFPGIGTAIGGALGALVGIIANWEVIGKTMGEAWNSISQKMSAVWDSMGGWIHDLWASTTSFFSKVGEWIMDVPKKLWAGIKGFFGITDEGDSTTADEKESGLLKLLKSFFEISPINIALDTIKSAKNYFFGKENTASAATEESLLVKKSKDAIENFDILDSIKSTGSTIWQGARSLAGTTINTIGSAVSNYNPKYNTIGRVVSKLSGKPVDFSKFEINKPVAGLSPEAFRLYAGVLAQRESSGRKHAVNQYGYLGLFQMGAAALSDIGFVKKGTTNKQLDNPAVWNYGLNKQKFLEDENAQLAAFADYTEVNSRYVAKQLKSMGIDYDALDEKQKASILASSHLTGAATANDVMKAVLTGKERSGKVDGNNVDAISYYRLMENQFSGENATKLAASATVKNEQALAIAQATAQAAAMEKQTDKVTAATLHGANNIKSAIKESAVANNVAAPVGIDISSIVDKFTKDYLKMKDAMLAYAYV